MKSLKVLAVAAALVLAPISAIATPAESTVASKYASDLMPPVENAIVRGHDKAKIDKVWWRGRAYGWRRFGWRAPIIGYYGWRRPWAYYAWRRPYWHRPWVL